MVHSTAHGSVLYSSLVKNAALTTLVFVAELSLSNIRHNLVLSVRMQGPDGPGTQGIIVQHAEVSETVV